MRFYLVMTSVLMNMKKTLFTVLEKLIGSKVIGIDIDQPSIDLKIFFDNGYILTIICINTEKDEDGTDFGHYTFYCPEGSFGVSGKGVVSFDDNSAKRNINMN